MKKNQTNRLLHTHADYLLVIVRKPDGWVPSDYVDVPPGGTILSVAHVASFAEAHDDLVRCNRLAMREKLSQWAVIHSPGTDL